MSSNRLQGKSSSSRNDTPTGALARFEEVPTTEESSFGVFTYDKTTFERGWHYHPQAELTLILEGSGTRFVGDHIGHFESGDLVLIGPTLPHSWRSAESRAIEGGKSRSVYIHFSAEVFEDSLDEFPEFREIRQLLARAARGLHFSPTARVNVAKDIELLLSLPALKRLVSLWEILDTLAGAEDAVDLSSAGFTPSLDQQTSERVARIHKHVFAHFDREIPHGELASLVSMTPSALSHFFRRATGRTLTDFINEVRVGQAARLLMDTSLNVSEIAFTCGFSNLSHFNATFRRLKGHNPTGFRSRRITA